MKYFNPVFICLSTIVIGLLSACSGEPSIEKAIVGTWVQETPYSITDRGLQTTTKTTALRLRKDGETHLTRNLEINGQGLPETGINVSVELSGTWELAGGQISQTPSKVLVIPRETDEVSRKWADELQTQAEQNSTSVKSIISANKTQLILQDAETGTTDVYRRKS